MHILNRCVYKNSETENKLLHQNLFFQIKSILQSSHCWKLDPKIGSHGHSARHTFGIAFRTTVFWGGKNFIL